MTSHITKSNTFFLQPLANLVPAIVTALKYSPYIQKIYGGGSFKTTNIYSYNRDDNDISSLPSISVFHNTVTSSNDYYGWFGSINMVLYDEISNNRADSSSNIDSRIAVVIDTIQNPNFVYAVENFLVDYNKNMSIPGFVQIKEKYNIIDRLGFDLTANFGYNIKLTNIGDCWKSSIKFNYMLSKEAYRKILEQLGVEIYYDPNEIIYPSWDLITVDIEEI